MAECAAILAVASSKSKNFVQRNALQSAAASWFAASGDLAISEGTPSEDANWEGKVANWAGQIGSMEALERHGDWMAYCAGIGAQHGLDTGTFAQGAG